MTEPMVHLQQYQDAAMRTLPFNAASTILALGLCGETGEVAEIIKKHVAHGHKLDKDALKKELGDVLWYLTAIAECHGMTLTDIAQANIAKLRQRYPDGFSSEASINRRCDGCGFVSQKCICHWKAT